MTETVTSKFSKSIWAGPITRAVVMFILIVAVVALAEQDYSPSNAREMIVILLILMGLAIISIYGATNSFIKVTVSPDVLQLHNLLTGKQITINYRDIIHVELLRDIPRSYRIPTIVEAIKLKIELNNGKNIYLYEESYQNFDELKEAIRRARFKLE